MAEETLTNPSSPLRASVERLDQQIENLGKLIDILSVRTHPIVALNEHTDNDLAKPVEAPRSEYRSWIDRITDDILVIQSKVQYINENLEV